MMKQVKVGIVMGSISDWSVLQKIEILFDQFGIEYEKDIVSAHRTPENMMEYAKNAQKRGLKVIIAGAGGAAHLPGMIAAVFPLPVIGVPICSRNSLAGIDSLLSIVQMPMGVPVATVAVNGAENAGVLALQILATSDEALLAKLVDYKNALKKKVEDSKKEL